MGKGRPEAAGRPGRRTAEQTDVPEEEIRAAYLRKVKEFPPERAPEEFERIRDAYEILRDPHRRIAHMLFSVDPMAPLASLAAGRPAARKFVGPEPWLAIIRKK